MVPFLDLARQNGPLRSHIDAAIGEILDRNAFVGGEAVQNFEGEISRYLRVQHAIGVANGTDALVLALRALEVLPGDEVVVPAFTFVATASVVTAIGARPVFADVDLDTFCLDPKSFEDVVTTRTKAVIPVHLYGHPADMDGILRVARKRGIRVIEDACQAIGASYKGRRVGGLGDAAAFSFYPTKNLSALGDGGLLTTDDREVADRLRLMRDHGQAEKYRHVCWGTNSRLDGLQAAVLRLKLRRLDAWNDGRRKVAARYQAGLADTPLVLPKAASGCEPVWHLYTVRVPGGKRDELLNHLKERQIGSAVHYRLPVNRQPSFSYLAPPAMPRSERLSSEVLSLPMFPELSEDEQDRVIAAVREFAF